MYIAEPQKNKHFRRVIITYPLSFEVAMGRKVLICEKIAIGGLGKGREVLMLIKTVYKFLKMYV